MQLIGGGGGGVINKALGNTESILAGIKKKTERLVRYLAIEEALQDEINETLEHSNRSYVDWCALTDKKKTIKG